jgi:hypothetical protein
MKQELEDYAETSMNLLWPNSRVQLIFIKNYYIINIES